MTEKTPFEVLIARFGEVKERDRAFAGSVVGRAWRDRAKQQRWAETLIERLDEAKAEAAAPPAPKASVGNVAGIVALLDRGSVSGLKQPKILFKAGDWGLCLSIASARARCPGSIDVATKSEWFGRIHRDGTFEPSRRIRPETATGIVAALQALAADPERVAREYGRETGICCFCAHDLTDPVSVHVGYGPICADRYSLPHRSSGLTAESVKMAA